MLQQAARLIMKTWKKIKSGKEKASGLLAYLNDVDSLLAHKSDIRTVEDLFDLNRLDKALAVRAAQKVKHTMELIAQKTKEGASENERVHSLLAVDIVSMAQSHIMYVAFQIYRQEIEKVGAIKCPNLLSHLQDLGKLFAMTELQ